MGLVAWTIVLLTMLGLTMRMMNLPDIKYKFAVMFQTFRFVGFPVNLSYTVKSFFFHLLCLNNGLLRGNMPPFTIHDLWS